MANLPPLPDGWSQERALGMSPIEFMRLPKETSAKIQAYLDALVANGAQESTSQSATHVEAEEEDSDAGKEERDMTEEELAETSAQAGLHVSDLRGVFANVSQQIVDEGLDVWGFVVFKTWGFGADSTAWEEFWKRWQRFMDSHLRTLGMTGDLKTGLAGRLTWHLVEAEGATIDQVRAKFEEAVEPETLPNGLELDLCLMVDEASAKSLLHPRDGVVPYVTGIMSDRAKEDAAKDDPRDQGYFKVAMDVLVPDVWYLLSEASPGQINPGGGVMYRGSLTADADGGSGKRELIPLS